MRCAFAVAAQGPCQHGDRAPSAEDHHQGHALLLLTQERVTAGRTGARWVANTTARGGDASEQAVIRACRPGYKMVCDHVHSIVAFITDKPSQTWWFKTGPGHN